MTCFWPRQLLFGRLPGSGWENIRIKRFWCSLLWLFGDYRAVSSLPFYRVAALYPRTSWDYVWCYYHGKRNYFSAVNSGLPTWRGHQLFSLAMGPAMVVGPWIGLNMARWDAFTAAFWLCSAVAALGIVLSLIVTVPPVIRHADGSKPNLVFPRCLTAPPCLLRWSPFYDFLLCRRVGFHGAVCS